MRIGDGSLYFRLLQGFDATRGRLDEATRGLADGKRVRVASDDPAAAHASLKLRGRLVQIQGFDRAGQNARFDLATIDNVLGEVTNLLSSARAEAMAGASGTLPAGGAARASKIDALRAQLLSLANTQQNGHYLFAGTATTAAPFAPSGAYSGNDAETTAPIESDAVVGSTVSGNRVFKQPDDMFTTLSDLSQALLANDAPGIAAAIPKLATMIKSVGDVRADVGNRMQWIDATNARHLDETTQIASRIGELEDADIAKLVTDLQSAETAQSALSAAAARVLGRSLFDYLG